MLIFNGRLLIKSCEATAVDRWSVSAKFVDNTGQFTAYNVAVGNRVYARGTNDNGDSALCAYKVVDVTQRATTANTLVCALQYDEAYTTVAEVYTPDLEEDAVVCEASSDAGFAMVPGDVTGLPQTVLDYMKNIALWQHDERFTTKVEAMLAEAGSGSLSAGVLDGDLTVTGKVSAGNGYRVLNETDQEVGTWKVDELRVNVAGEQPVMSLNMNASTKATPTMSVVSGGDIDATTVLNATGASSRKTTVTGVSGATDEEEVTSRGDVAWSVKANGATATADVTATGVNSASVTVTAKATAADGDAVITLDSPKTRATGQLSAAGIVSEGTAAAQKFVRTGDTTQTSPDDNELVTAAYLRAYVLANAGGSATVPDDVAALLAGKANAADVYTKTETDSLLSSITLATLTGDVDHRTVTDAQIASWDAKSNVEQLTYVPENIANKGIPNGYASLDDDGFVATTQMNETYINGLIDARVSSGGVDTAAVERIVTNALAGYERLTDKGEANGYAALDENGKVVTTQMNEEYINGLIDARALSGLSVSADNVVETDEKRFVSFDQISAWDYKQDKLEFTPENIANKGVPGGYAALDENGVLAEYLVNVNKVEEVVDGKLELLSTDNVQDTATHRYVSDAQIAAWNSKADLSNAEVTTNKGIAGGYAALDENGKVPLTQLNEFPVVTLSIDGSYSLENVTENTKLAFTGSQHGDVVDDVKIYVVNDGTPVQLGELAEDSTLSIPWGLLTNVPIALAQFGVNGTLNLETISDIPEVTPGTYTSVTVDEHGFVTSGKNPKKINAESTSSSTWSVGANGDVEEFVTFVADVGMMKNPFIRYNVAERRWEYSNNGHDIYAFGIDEPVHTEGFDCGYVSDNEIEAVINCRDLVEETKAHLDFNGDAYADLANTERADLL